MLPRITAGYQRTRSALAPTERGLCFFLGLCTKNILGPVFEHLDLLHEGLHAFLFQTMKDVAHLAASPGSGRQLQPGGSHPFGRALQLRIL